MGLVGIYAVCRRLLISIPRHEGPARATDGSVPSESSGSIWSREHTALNICLFPPLFFFCGLYYTDVISVLLVLLAYDAFHRRSPVAVLAFGMSSLILRQTNIFWTAVYLAGLEVLRRMKRATESVKLRKEAGFLEVVMSSWKHGCFYDPLIQDAWFEGSFIVRSPLYNANMGLDYLKTTTSLGVAALSQSQSLILPLFPYISLLVMFAGFVLVNGGVVLGTFVHGVILVTLQNFNMNVGDKENHVASLHLPQILYIWPYIAFFSFPILLPSLVPALLSCLPSLLLNAIPSYIRPSPPQVHTASTTPRLILILTMLIPTLTIIHFNTLIHPFTLADNRHYTFYVFRLLCRHAATRYLVAPLYLFFSWAVIQTLAVISRVQNRSLSPSFSTSTVKAAGVSPAQPHSYTSNSQEAIQSDSRCEGQSISFLILWLLTSALTLVTAPLVEPRYFILPWLIWRLHVPQPDKRAATTTNILSTSSTESTTSQPRAPVSTSTESAPAEPSRPAPARSSSWNLRQVLLRPENVLWLETAWLLAVNAGTGYIFLKWGFEWRQEVGKVQRFMW